MTEGKSLRLVEIPQAIVVMMSSMVSQFVIILKDSALGFIILNFMLTWLAQILARRLSSRTAGATEVENPGIPKGQVGADPGAGAGARAEGGSKT